MDVVTFPSHTSHILQPLDKSVNGAFKNKFKVRKNEARTMARPERREFLIELADRSLWTAFNPYIVRESFEITGICPWDVENHVAHPM